MMMIIILTTIIIILIIIVTTTKINPTVDLLYRPFCKGKFEGSMRICSRGNQPESPSSKSMFN